VSAYLTQVLTLTAINAIATLGFYVTASAGQLSIAQAAFFAIGGYMAGWVMIESGIPLLAALPLAFVFAGAASSVLFAATRLQGLFFAVATFGFGIAVAGGIVFIDFLGGPFGLYGIPIETTFLLTIVTLVIAFVLIQFFDRSPLYLAFAAVRDDPDVAAVLGIRTGHVKRIGIVVGAGLAGTAGVLYGSSVGVIVPADASFERSLAFLLMAIIGGSRTSWGALLGAVIWTLAPEILRFSEAPEWRLILFGSLAILIMPIRPQGLLNRGDAARVARFIRARTSTAAAR
jgi:branched-chain amino acid transport system permease protein